MAFDAVSITAIVISIGTCLTGLIAGVKFIHCHSGCCDLDIKGKDNKTPPNTPHFVIEEPPLKEKNISNV